MACYSYTTGLPVLYNNNVEVVFAKLGTTYSYNSLMWICELSVSDQLKVFTRPTPTGTETLRIENTDYTISGTNIVFTNAALIPDGGEVVIRRSTRSDKMVLRFTDGAKLAAKDLNDCFHQLLFTIQEKEFEGSTIVYGESGNIQFINASPPYTFNLAGLAPGKALVWNGTQFVADEFTGTLHALSDVTISSATPGDLLIYNGTQWVDQAPSFDITQNNIKLANRAFYNNVNTSDTSYVSSGTPVTAPGALSVFKRTSPTADWVLTDPPTVYHIIKKSLPGEEDPITFFANVDSQLTSLAANVSNPVKAKFEWRLNVNKQRSIVDSTTGESIASSKTMFWESPVELYNPSGYVNSNLYLLHHGILNTTNGIYRDGAFYTQTLTAGGTPVSFFSKISGYNIRSFYLSIPESSSTNFKFDQINVAQSTYNSLSINNMTLPNLYDALNAPGGADVNNWRDYYLIGLRDMAFAAARPLPTDQSNTKNRDGVSRYNKNLVIAADYNGFGDIQFRRLEAPGESITNVLWKIPKQIIYYNKAALVLASKDSNDPIYSNSGFNRFNKNTVRFQGYGALQGNPADYAQSQITTGTAGYFFKADEYWTEWTNRWSTDTNQNYNYRFNEADIDWLLEQVQTPVSAIKFFGYLSNTPIALLGSGTAAASNTGFNTLGLFPWAFRPNDPKVGDDRAGCIGTHLFNIDANKLFSESSNFIPDPMDEYVFRVVCKKGITPFFTTTPNDPINPLKTCILLEHGFSEQTNSGYYTEKNNIVEAFIGGFNYMEPSAFRAYSRCDLSKIKVYVKKETIEVIDNEKRLVVTISILVPRLKSIGYAKVFRTLNFNNASGTAYPTHNSNGEDTEIDSGPWNFNFQDAQDNNTEGNDASDVYKIAYKSGSFIVASNPRTVHVSGRNECAVKFTRMGIPSTLWIRMSILNTNGSVQLIDSNGLIPQAISE
jgi:hypothetical protein